MSGEIPTNALLVENGEEDKHVSSRGSGKVYSRHKKDNAKEAKVILEVLFSSKVQKPLSGSEICPPDVLRHPSVDGEQDSEWDDFSDLNDELEPYCKNQRKAHRKKRDRPKSEELKRLCQTASCPAELGRKKRAAKTVKAPFGLCKKEIVCWKNKKDNVSYRKENIEKNLKKKNIQRKWPDGMPKLEWAVNTRETIKLGKQRRKPKWAASHNTGPLHIYNNSDFVLKADNADKFGGDQLLNLLIQLQDRDITPEDFEALLQLDDFVQPKTVSRASIDSLTTDVIQSEIDDVCMICLECYATGDVRKHLPCGHGFHSSCVGTWLGTVSSKCPIDGQEIQ